MQVSALPLVGCHQFFSQAGDTLGDLPLGEFAQIQRTLLSARWALLASAPQLALPPAWSGLEDLFDVVHGVREHLHGSPSGIRCLIWSSAL